MRRDSLFTVLTSHGLDDRGSIAGWDKDFFVT